jgi:hypothetical protein
MEFKNIDIINHDITIICKKYQEERPSGRWYITTNGLNQVSKILGGKYSNLTTSQKKNFRQDCVSQAQDSIPIE